MTSLFVSFLFSEDQNLALLSQKFGCSPLTNSGPRCCSRFVSWLRRLWQQLEVEKDQRTHDSATRWKEDSDRPPTLNFPAPFCWNFGDMLSIGNPNKRFVLSFVVDFWDVPDIHWILFVTAPGEWLGIPEETWTGVWLLVIISPICSEFLIIADSVSVMCLHDETQARLCLLCLPDRGRTGTTAEVCPLIGFLLWYRYWFKSCGTMLASHVHFPVK